MAIPPGRLDAQLRLLVARGYRAAGFSDIVAGGRFRRGRRGVAITFDDGLQSVVSRAVPILARHGLVGTVFLPTAHVGRARPVDWPVVGQWIGGPHEHELAPMTWDDAARLVQAGWEVGSHTVTHPDLTVLDDAALREELVESRRECEDRLGVRCRSLAYPYGAVDRRVARAARRAGYDAAAALPGRIHRRSRWRWPRVGVWHNDPEWVFGVKLSPPGRRRLDLATGSRGLVAQWRFCR
jgi:peptidoglycan/xylan/chitin deacetylase (PgdA/CDA1 family)